MYCDDAKSKKCGTDQLTSTLNSYFSQIVQGGTFWYLISLSLSHTHTHMYTQTHIHTHTCTYTHTHTHACIHTHMERITKNPWDEEKRASFNLLLMKKRKSCPPGQMQSLGRGVSCEFTCTLRNPGIIVCDGGYKVCGKLSACTIAHPPQFVLVSITA